MIFGYEWTVRDVSIPVRGGVESEKAEREREREREREKDREKKESFQMQMRLCCDDAMFRRMNLMLISYERTTTIYSVLMDKA